ncbi:hypothetical protein P8452_57009 [Trifolium repens]|nr:hypothetical protein P8452_57009 [Trifolium repens]
MNGTGWRWNLTWRRNFFSWEIPLFHEMLGVIEGFQPLDCEDSWQWRADPTAGFTSKSAYHALINLQNNVKQFLSILLREGLFVTMVFQGDDGIWL